MGRHSEFTQETADLICARIIGGDSLRSICAEPAMPGEKTVYQWLAKDSVFAQQYTRAREAQMEVMATEILEISDERATDPTQVQRNRLRVDTRKWLMGKLQPKKYGEKVTLAGDAVEPLRIIVTRE